MAKNLPHDIIFNEILTRLPVKSLLRFRCVSKSWCCLISNDPQFLKNHLSRTIRYDADNANCRRKLILGTSTFLHSIDLGTKEIQNNNNGDNASSSSCSPMVLDFIPPSIEDEVFVTCTGSCNGLVCILVMSSTSPETIILCNPCTRKFKELPKPTFSSHNCPNYGFGYDSAIEDYKVVRHDWDNGTVEVFSLKLNCWRKKAQVFLPNIIELRGDGDGVFLNGALHWIGNCESSLMIVSFNLETEEFRELVTLTHNAKCVFLTVLGGCLSVVISPNFEVWMMKEYGMESSWTKLFIDNKNADDMVPWFPLENGEVLMGVNDGRNLKMYNPKEMTFRDLDIEDEWIHSPVSYIETLVSPNGNQA